MNLFLARLRQPGIAWGLFWSGTAAPPRTYAATDSLGGVFACRRGDLLRSHVPNCCGCCPRM